MEPGKIFRYLVEKFDEKTPRKVRPDYVWKFLVAGGIGMVVDMSVLFSLVNNAGLAPVVSKVVATETAIITIFFINELWTFREHGEGSIFSRLARSNAGRIAGLLVSVGCLKIFLMVSGNLLLSNLAAIGAGMVFNYAFETTFTWKL